MSIAQVRGVRSDLARSNTMSKYHQLAQTRVFSEILACCSGFQSKQLKHPNANSVPPNRQQYRQGQHNNGDGDGHGDDTGGDNDDDKSSTYLPGDQTVRPGCRAASVIALPGSLTAWQALHELADEAGQGMVALLPSTLKPALWTAQPFVGAV